MSTEDPHPMAQTRAARPSRPKQPTSAPPSFVSILIISLAVAAWTAALVLAGGIVAYQVTHQERIFDGVSVRGIDLSSMTLPEAEARLRIAFAPYPLAPVTVRHAGQSWILSAEDLGVDFDATSAARAAYQVGRREMPGREPTAQIAALQAALQEQLAAYRHGYEVLALETIDQAAGLEWLRDRASEIDRPMVNASLTVDGLTVAATESQVGYHLDLPANHRAIYEALLANHGGTVDLMVKESDPLLADVSQAEVFLRQVFAGPITLAAAEPDLDAATPGPSYTIPAQDLAGLVSLETLPQLDGTLEIKASLHPQGLRPMVLGWSAELAREPRDARLDFDPKSGEITVLSPSQIGRTLDVDATLEAIREAALSPQRQAALPLRLVEPGSNMHRIAEMGIVELVAQASTNFAGSSKDRVHNIATGAAAVNGTVVPPGEVFSFNRTIGEVDAEHGYKDSLIIWGDRTAVGIGGGICQVSTTVFRTAYLGGLPIEERYNHGYVVGWYGQPGLDATIYTPSIDLKFRNTTGHHLLIESQIDEAKGILTFYFYGTNPGWQVEVSGPEIVDQTPAPAPIYQEDDSLATGQIKQVETAKKGLDVQWQRLIRDADGQLLSEEVLESNYIPWPAYYLFGPGTEIPTGTSSPTAVQSEG